MHLPIRDNLIGLEPYEDDVAPECVRLGFNEVGESVPEKVVKEMQNALITTLPGLNRYPDHSMAKLREVAVRFLNDRFGTDLTIDNLFFANGATELILQIFNTFGGPSFNQEQRTIFSFQPGYIAYLDDARDSKSNLYRVRLDSNFQIDPDLTIAEIQKHRPALVLFTNPENPTGTLTPLSTFRKIIDQTQEVIVAGTDRVTHPLYISDEAYIEFAENTNASAIHLLQHYPNLLVLRTLSKSFGLAGLRVGYIVGSPKVIYPVTIVRQPYSFSNVTQALATVAFRNSEILMKPIKKIIARRRELLSWLEGKQYQGYSLKVVPSQTNFCLVGFDPQIPNYLDLPNQVVDFLIDKDVLVRKVAVPGYFRVSIGTETELSRFKHVFNEFLE